MKQNKIIPKLRFPEFENEQEWEMTTLDKVALYENGKAHEQDISENGDYIVVNAKFIATNGEVRKHSNTAVCLADKNDILMVLSDLPNGRALGKCFYVDMENKYTVNQRICKLSSKGTNSVLLYYLLDRNSYFLSFDDGVKQSNLKKDDILDCPLTISSNKDEQEKIANCLSSLDEVIAQHEEKRLSLEEHKKGLMQNLFPQEGETKPKYRFPEFENEGEWEEKKLGKMSKFRRGSFPQPYGLAEWYDENGEPFVQVFDVDENLRLKQQTQRRISKLASEQSVFIPKGTVIITIQGSIGRVAITQYDAYVDRTLLLFEKFYTPIVKVFFAYVLQILFGIEKQKAPGAVIKTITKEVLSDFIIKLPSIKEQQKIADCLSSIDSLISETTERIEELKQHKQGLMQSLFPKIKE